MMRELSPIVYEHKYQFSPLRIVVMLAGIGALALAASNVMPLLTTMISIIYGFILPTGILWKPIAARFPQFRPFAAAIVALAALVPVWIIILSVIWVFDNRLTEWQVAGLLTVVIAGVTMALLWWFPPTATLNIQWIMRRYSSGAGFFAIGLMLGFIIALIAQML